MKHYYVDEAGDGTIFDYKGRIVVGNNGVSKYFMLGYTHIEDPDMVENALGELRRQIYSDDFFSHIATMDPAEKKTALLFHAKDDHSQVRYLVLDLLRKLPGLHFHAVAMNKLGVARFVTEARERDSEYRYRVNDLYDYMVRRLFYNRLHIDYDFEICFAERDSSDRTTALEHALSSAGNYFTQICGIPVSDNIKVLSKPARKVISLQVTDYFLWTLQRYFEKDERGYYRGLRHSYSMVLIDDYQIYPNKTTLYYNKKKPLPL